MKSRSGADPWYLQDTVLTVHTVHIISMEIVAMLSAVRAGDSERSRHIKISASRSCEGAVSIQHTLTLQLEAESDSVCLRFVSCSIQRILATNKVSKSRLTHDFYRSIVVRQKSFRNRGAVLCSGTEYT